MEIKEKYIIVQPEMFAQNFRGEDDFRRDDKLVTHLNGAGDNKYRYYSAWRNADDALPNSPKKSGILYIAKTAYVHQLLKGYQRTNRDGYTINCDFPNQYNGINGKYSKDSNGQPITEFEGEIITSVLGFAFWTICGSDANNTRTLCSLRAIDYENGRNEFHLEQDPTRIFKSFLRTKDGNATIPDYTGFDEYRSTSNKYVLTINEDKKNGNVDFVINQPSIDVSCIQFFLDSVPGLENLKDELKSFSPLKAVGHNPCEKTTKAKDQDSHSPKM